MPKKPKQAKPQKLTKSLKIEDLLPNSIKSTDSDSDDNKSFGCCIGETFKCSECKYYVLIENDNYPGGDKHDCLICENSLCDTCCIYQCIFCEECEFCKQCLSQCNVCKLYVCSSEDCSDEIMQCVKCKNFVCSECVNCSCKL